MKVLLKSFFLGLLFTFIFLNTFLLNLDKPIDLSHGDTFHTIFTLKHYMNIFSTKNWGQIWEVPMFYGFPNSLLFSEHFIFYAIVAYPLYILMGNIILTFNILAVLAILLSFIAIFFFTRFVTKDSWSSTLAAVIFVFNPYVLGHFPDTINYYFLFFIPLIFLYLEKSLLKPTSKNIFIFFLLLSMQVVSTVTLGGLLSLILPVYSILRWLTIRTNIIKFVNIGLITGVLLFVLVVGVTAFLYSNRYLKEPYERTLEDITAYSPWASDLFLGSNSYIYKNLRQKASDIAPNFVLTNPSAERSIFWGITPLILFILSFKFLKKVKYSKLYSTLVILTFYSLLLSFGPEIRFTNNFAIPNIYSFFYTLNPLLAYLRVSSRFVIFTFFFLSLIVALTSQEALKNFKIAAKRNIYLLIIVLIVVEYWNGVWSYTKVPYQIKQFYSQLEQKQDIGVIMEIPMGNLFGSFTLARNRYIDSSYLLWATLFHNKRLVNGYSSYTPSKYTKKVEYLSINFPNFKKLNELKSQGVDTIILHKEEFAYQTEYKKMVEQFDLLGVPLVLSEGKFSLYSLKDWTTLEDRK